MLHPGSASVVQRDHESRTTMKLFSLVFAFLLSATLWAHNFIDNPNFDRNKSGWFTLDCCFFWADHEEEIRGATIIDAALAAPLIINPKMMAGSQVYYVLDSVPVNVPVYFY